MCRPWARPRARRRARERAGSRRRRRVRASACPARGRRSRAAGRPPPHRPRATRARQRAAPERRQGKGRGSPRRPPPRRRSRRRHYLTPPTLMSQMLRSHAAMSRPPPPAGAPSAMPIGRGRRGRPLAGLRRAGAAGAARRRSGPRDSVTPPGHRRRHKLILSRHSAPRPRPPCRHARAPRWRCWWRAWRVRRARGGARRLPPSELGRRAFPPPSSRVRPDQPRRPTHGRDRHRGAAGRRVVLGRAREARDGHPPPLAPRRPRRRAARRGRQTDGREPEVRGRHGRGKEARARSRRALPTPPSHLSPLLSASFGSPTSRCGRRAR